MLGACGSDDGVPADTPEGAQLELIIQSLGPSPVRSVEYTANCVGDEDPSAPDEIILDGKLELEDKRAVKIGMLGPESETWAGFLDLLPGSCRIQLRARDGDGEVICTADVPFSVFADAVTQVVVPLPCSSAGTVPGGNLCPDLLALSCDELDPLEASTTCEVRFRDSDDTCGPGCDPQTCTATAAGVTCSPGPDPGVTTTITCPDALLDCTGDGPADPSCVVDANPSNTLPEFDEASFSVTCIAPEPDSTLGKTITCTAVTSDGDIDCDKTRVINIDCPDVDP